MERRRILLCWFVPLLLYLSNLDGTWIQDDHYHVEQNPYIRSAKHIPRILTTTVWQSTSEETTRSDIYRPVLMMSWMADQFLFGLRPWGFHLINNVFHAVNCVLLYALLRTFLGSSSSLLGGLLFAVHPLGVEAVSWIGGRQDLLLALLALCNIHALLKWLKSPSPIWIGLYALTLPLGLFSKESFVLVPIAGIAALLISSGDRRETAARLKSPCAVLIGVFIGCFLWRNEIVRRSFFELLSPELFGNALALAKRFLLLLFVPADSDFLFPYRARSFAWMSAALPFALITALIASLMFAIRKNTAAVLGILFLLAPLVPAALVLDLVGTIAERYFYLPMVGIALLFAASIEGLEKRVSVPRLGAWIGCLLLVLSLVTVARNREWRDEETLYRSSIQRDPSNEAPYFLLAWHYHRSGSFSQEIEAYRDGLQRNPRHFSMLNNLAVRLTERGEFVEAKELLKRAYGLYPRVARVSYNVGYFYERTGEVKNARKWYGQAIQLDPTYEIPKIALRRLGTSSTP